MDRFWWSRCLNSHIKVSNMMGSLASSTYASLVAKTLIRKIFSLLLIKSLPVDQFSCLRCLNNCIDLPHLIGSLASGATNSLVTKIGTKYFATSCLVYIFWTNRQILIFKVCKWPYWSSQYDRITCKWRHFLPGGQKFNLKWNQPYEEL